ncbi:MAG: enediyne biosynthesis protein, partial [Blastocatellia bacterium]|nr:enediyne biosynthesis protein [Blastocatellia bacterium]
ARVIVTDGSGHREIFDESTAGSYLSASDPRIIAGLGNASTVRTVEIRWPSGLRQTISNPEVDRYLIINERETPIAK